MRRRRAALGVVLAVLSTLVWPLTGSPGADAQTGARLEVVEQTSFVPGEGEFVAVLSWTGPIEDHHLRVRIFQLVGDEADLEERSPTGQLNQLPPVPLTELERDAGGRLVVRMPIRGLPLPDGDPARIFLPDPGVYPLEIEITGPDDAKVASRFTDLIRLPGDLADLDPVPVAVVIRVGSGGVSLPEVTHLLERAPTVPVTVVVDPALLEHTAAIDPPLVERFALAIGDRHLVADGRRLDLSALAEIGHLQLYDQVRRSGAARSAGILGRAVSADVVVLDERPTAEGAAHLARSGVIGLAPVGTPEGKLRTPAGRVPVISADEDLMQALGRTGLDGYHLLARLAVRLHNGEADPVLLTAAPRSGVRAEDLAVVLDGLSQPGIATAVPLAQVVDRATVSLTPSERPRQDLRATAALLDAALQDLREYATFHVSGDLPPAYLENRIVAALATDVAPARRTERLAAVRVDIDEAFDVIALPQGRTVNLAATTSPLPLSLTSRAPGVRRVRITFASDKLTFPDEEGGSRLVELGTGATALDFVVESRSLGVSPLDVVVSTPDGSRELARTRITIRSTAVPGLGLLLSGAALAFLIGWWALHLRGRSSGTRVLRTEPVA
jgi:hypothetical protein